MIRSLRRVVGTRAAAARRPTSVMLMAFLVGTSLAFTMAFACATPFSALAAVSVLRLRLRDALATVTLAWFVNQADGFLFQHYPQTWDCIGWGVTIWLAAMAATFAALAFSRTFARMSLAARSWGAMATAFLIYEGALVAATVAVSSSTSPFSALVLGHLFAIDGFAYVLLLALVGLLDFVASIRSLTPTTHGADARKATM